MGRLVGEGQRGPAYLDKVIAGLEDVPPGGRTNALGQGEVEDALYAAAEANELVSDPKDGPRKTWATIRSGLSKGLLQPIDLDDDGPPVRRRRRKKEEP